MDNGAQATQTASSSSIPWCSHLLHHPAEQGCGMPTAHRAKAGDKGAQPSKKEPSDPKKSWEEHPSTPSLPADSSAVLRPRRRLAFPLLQPGGEVPPRCTPSS